MSWTVRYLPEAERDVRGLDGSLRAQYDKAIRKVSQNPLPATRGGYGKPLGNKGGRNLTGLLKIKLRGAGLRAVYKVLEDDTIMLVIVVGDRDDEEVYDLAAQRMALYPEYFN